MRISTKGRYGLAVMTALALSGESLSAPELSGKTGISKIYLEQVLTPLRAAGLLQSVKGARGGYFLAEPPEKTAVLDILRVLEPSLFEPAGVSAAVKEIDAALQTAVFIPLDAAAANFLKSVTLRDAAARVSAQGEMFYI